MGLDICEEEDEEDKKLKKGKKLQKVNLKFYSGG